MDGRRHSVDVPISRALIALRRVRSLRDPSTSMSKLNALVDTVNWETDLNDAITLGFGNSCRRVSDEEHHVNDHELYYGSKNCKSMLMPPQESGAMVGNKGSTHRRSLCVEGSDARRPLDLSMVFDNKALSERYCNEYGDKYFEFTSTAPSGEGGASCNEPDEVLRQVKRRTGGRSQRQMWHSELDVMSGATTGDVTSRAGSPCLSAGEAQREESSHGMSLYKNEDVGFMESCHQGCGMSSCWSRGRKFRDHSLLRDVEERPLLSDNATAESFDSKLNCEGVSPYVETPRSLSQKFMPKSFSELVGQNTVATSLLSAISQRHIASLYLFHGPRGTGKTSASRIFAAALNCLSSETTRPCGLCKECGLFFSGRSSDVKEVDSVRTNKRERCRLLIKNARIPPAFSRFKVYIIDECHLMSRETWAAILNGLEELPRHVVFIMVTPNLDKIPRSALAKSQKHHFQKVREVDIASKLGKICVQEGLDFDQDALNFIATRSNGSLRDAEMMLDQLSLLGKKITIPLVHEVSGVVSDDELLDLLYLAMSSDASNTVKKARELMRSRIDPLQLTSQLASLIMDILAGKLPDGVSDKRRKLFGADNSEDDLNQLSHALKILSQTEKQLRMSNNQMTWLTVALLQLSSSGSAHDGGDPRLSTRSLLPQDGDFPSTSSTTGESFKRSAACACVDAESANTGAKYDKETLELVWIRAAGTCTSHSLKKFLLKRGSLVSVCLTQAGIAVIELEFDHPDHASKAEKSWKEIAGALQRILGYNVELRIKLARDDSNKKLRKPCLGLFNCSRRVHLRPQLSAESGSNTSENSSSTPTTVRTRDKYVETCSSECGSRISCTCCHGKELFKTIRSSDGNALSIEASAPDGVVVQENQLGSKPRSKEHLRFHCWRAATFPFRKAWQLRHHHHRGERLVDYTLHCAVAK